ncbi:MAG: T9SS type A sorting domain-containing protein, partial [Spirosomaceae bacterium]|nr:T9SS type A sorting domain-containing protein [Spirosomataceae bacterium]
DETAYQFVDQTPNFGVNYYRLKKVDIDGTSDYSRIITANMIEASPIVIYPNPSSDFIRIKNGEKEAIKSYEIYNISGRLIRQNESPATEIKIQDLPSGMYFLQLKNERNVLINRRFVKI